MKAKMINHSLRLIRLYWNKSQSQMAAELGISQSYLSEVEREQKEVTLDLLNRYSEIMRVPLSQILLFAEEIEGNPPPSTGRLFIAGKAVDLLRRLIPDEEKQS